MLNWTPPPSSSSLILQVELVGSDTTIAAGITVVAYAPVLELCRRLIAAGYDPGIRLEAYRESTLCLTVRSVQDDKTGTPTLRRWRNRAPGGGAASPIEFGGLEALYTGPDHSSEKLAQFAGISSGRGSSGGNGGAP
jgi:hypothetical protein